MRGSGILTLLIGGLCQLSFAQFEHPLECSANQCVDGCCCADDGCGSSHHSLCCPNNPDIWCPCCKSCVAHHHTPHDHTPHGHNPHGHNPHTHKPHLHHPGPAPMPVCETGWPVFASEAALTSSPWGDYFADLSGGSLPPASYYPLDTSAWWMLYDSLIAKHSLALPPSAGNCAPPNCQLNRFVENNAYSPPSQWIWHPPPYTAFPANTWVEVMHEQDPFGDEHNGAWYLHAKGSGVWYNIGTSITFGDHGDAYSHFNAFDNEAMCRAAAAAGYDSTLTRARTLY